MSAAQLTAGAMSDALCELATLMHAAGAQAESDLDMSSDDGGATSPGSRIVVLLEMGRKRVSALLELAGRLEVAKEDDDESWRSEMARQAGCRLNELADAAKGGRGVPVDLVAGFSSVIISALSDEVDTEAGIGARLAALSAQQPAAEPPAPSRGGDLDLAESLCDAALQTLRGMVESARQPAFFELEALAVVVERAREEITGG